MNTNVSNLPTPPTQGSKKATSLVAKMAERFGVDPAQFFKTLKLTAFKQRDGSAPTNEQMMALMIVSEQYGLNPFIKEIYAFPDKAGGIVPVVGVDGWIKMVNQHPDFDGIEFLSSENIIQMDGRSKPCPEWIMCIIHHKSRKNPTKIVEYLDECYQKPRTYDGPWQTHTKRFLRHKTLIQCGRVAFGFSGIYDPDEAERILEKEVGDYESPVTKAIEQAKAKTAEVEDFVPAALVFKDPQAEEVLSLEHLKVNDPLLEKLARRAASNGAWATAHEYVQDRFRNSNQELDYATQYLREKEMELMPVPQTIAAEMATQEPVLNQGQVIEQPPMPQGEGSYF